MDKDAMLEFKNNYMRMRQDRKWKLPSGKYVEDVLYEYAKNLAHESPIHSFIVDTSDATVMNLFSNGDQEHIVTFNVLPDPEIEDELMDYLLKYRKAIRDSRNAENSQCRYQRLSVFSQL
ncbi:hypothetical protein BC938DRAFT_471240 [Jimgerdemannia flammicorona]|uniref:Uncharacterized protein n=1 Tax=Jimgerdemannia flammicorona TaxID=994334 RepID=A0A433Q8F8_9FUNG|nr:hypothetical protein BC938DRAFT_471240 [Jimgerdemannia flammicorona]